MSKLPTAEACGLSFKRLNIMHSKIQTDFIGTQESVYRDSPAGKLDTKIAWVKDMHPLQQGFDSNGQARLPVCIDHLSAPALEQGYAGDVYIAFGASSHP